MSDELDDLDALFDEISAQSVTTKSADPQPVAKVLEMIDPASLDMSEAAPAVSVAVATDGVEVAAEAAHEGDKICNCGNSDVQMYDRLGPIVRQLHDALRELGYDRSLSSVVAQVSDSQDRLQYIAQLTEQAANKVLNLVDIALPEQDKQLQASKALNSRWDQMYAGELSVDEFKQLVSDSRDFIASSADQAEREKARLMDIMMAQDFQDISGQIIKKVVALTQQLERELAQLLHDYAPEQIREKTVDLLSGPVSPSAALVQDDVDAMLAELGF
jgi:chemotaxis protein CheZ